MINFNVTDADRNEFGEKYLLQKVKSDIGIIHLPIIIGVYSAFCNFLAQSGLISPQTDRYVCPTDTRILSKKCSFRYGNLYYDLFKMVFELGSNGKCNDLYTHWRHCFNQVSFSTSRGVIKLSLMADNFENVDYLPGETVTPSGNFYL